MNECDILPREHSVLPCYWLGITHVMTERVCACVYVHVLFISSPSFSVNWKRIWHLTVVLPSRCTRKALILAMKWLFLFSTRHLSFYWMTCQSGTLYNLHSDATHHSHAAAKHVRGFLKSTSLGESQIYTTCRPFRSLSNFLLIIWAFLHQWCSTKGTDVASIRSLLPV